MRNPVLKRLSNICWSLFFTVLFFLLGISQTVMAFELMANVDRIAGNEKITVANNSPKLNIYHDGGSPAHPTPYTNRYTVGGEIITSSIKIANLDGVNGNEIIGLTKLNSSQNQLFIINDYNKDYYPPDNSTSKTNISSLWKSSYYCPSTTTGITTSYNRSSPQPTTDIVITNLDGKNGDEIIVPSDEKFHIISYGTVVNNGDWGVDIEPYSELTQVQSYLISNLDGKDGAEVVGFSTVNSKRSVFIVNYTLSDPAYSYNYRDVETFTYGQGVISPSIVHAPFSLPHITNNLSILELGNGNGKELIGLYQINASSVGIFRISYGDDSWRIDDKKSSIATGGIYLGLTPSIYNARYVIANINGISPLDIYGYYGVPLSGGFIIRDNNFTTPLRDSSLNNFFSNNPNIQSASFHLIDADGDGYHDKEDECNTDPDKHLPGDCGCNQLETDTDGDGYKDCNDACPNGKGWLDSDGDDTCNAEDECPYDETGITNIDGDSKCDVSDECPYDGKKITRGLCDCGNTDPTYDVDGNGTIDEWDCYGSACPQDPDKFFDPGECGCGVPDIDSDDDETFDCKDECSFDPAKTDAGVCGCFVVDSDLDQNGIIDCLERPGDNPAVFYHNDPTGTPQAISDETGSPIWRAKYLPFGEEYELEGDTYNQRRFIGKEKDIETGLSYFGARYLDVSTGRFLAPDPVQVVDPISGQINSSILTDPQRLNLYGYGLNNPYRYVDSDGRSPRTPRVGPNGRPIPRQLQNSDAMARTAIRAQQSQNSNYTYQSIGQNNGGYLTQGDLQRITSRAARSLSPNAKPQRVQGPWTQRDLARAQEGKGPLDFIPTRNKAGREVPLELHHADQMPGSAVHEVAPFHSRINGAHPNRYNQGVTPQMRQEDAQLHWYMRGQEMGN